MVLLVFMIFWVLLVTGGWKLARYLIYRTGRRPAVFTRPWLRRIAFSLVLLIPFYGAIIDSLTFELACHFWGREIVNKPRQADGFEGYVVGRVELVADQTFQFIDMPKNEMEVTRFFLAYEGDEACSHFEEETSFPNARLPDVPSGKCLAIKHVPLGGARYVVSVNVLRKPFKENWFGHRLYKYEATIFDREEEKVVGLYRQLMAFRDSFFDNFFGDHPGRHICGQKLVRHDGVLRTLAPQTQKGHQ